MKLSTLSLAVATVASILATSASAYTLNLGAYTSTPAGPSDTRLLGSATNSPTTIDGTHSTVHLVTSETPAGFVLPPGVTGNQEKAAPFFYAGTLGTPIGTLGDLGRGGLTADWLLDSRGSTTPSFVGNIAAFRILVDGPTAGTFAEVIWETGYQSPVPTFAQGTNYDNVNIGSGKFYVRYLSQNYGDGNNGPVNALSLAQLASGAALTPALTNPTFADGTNIYGLQVSIGSDAGDYSAYVGDINASFVAVPEPTTLAALAGASVLGLRRRRA